MHDIRPADQHDLAQLIAAAADSPAAREHHRERWTRQARGEALYLLARADGAIVGHTMLLRGSKYAAVRAAHNPAEINALHAYEQGRGIGTALIAAAESLAADWGRDLVGLAVEPQNTGARRLYERLGYRQWDGGQVLDEWTEKDAAGQVIVAHQDPGVYLLKPLTAS
ncbi:MAG TPA: GNAT family N-acetyltransferase [Kribbella sp.]